MSNTSLVFQKNNFQLNERGILNNVNPALSLQIVAVSLFLMGATNSWVEISNQAKQDFTWFWVLFTALYAIISILSFTKLSGKKQFSYSEIKAIKQPLFGRNNYRFQLTNGKIRMVNNIHFSDINELRKRVKNATVDETN